MVQTVILYRNEIWVIIGETVKLLEAFQHQTARSITEKMAQNIREQGWESSLVEEAIEAVGLCQMQEYLRRRQVTIV